MTTTFLMCPPQEFDVNYEINPWMKGNIHQVDHQQAAQEWDDFYHHLEDYAKIELIEPQTHVPDLVFTANAGLVRGKQFVLSRFRHVERQPEEPIFKDWFEKKGYEVIELPKDVAFEGAGDALFQPEQDLLWTAHGFRSDPDAKDHLQKYFPKTKIISLKLVNENFYHLDTCFCPLLNNCIMYYPDAFDATSQKIIAETIPEKNRIVVNEGAAMKFACNAVMVKTDKIKNTIGMIFVNGSDDDLRKKLLEKGYAVVVQPVDEFNKSGGANKCLTLQI